MAGMGGGRLQAEQACLDADRRILSPVQQEAMGGKGLHRRRVQPKEGGYGCSQKGSDLRDLLGAKELCKGVPHLLSAIRTRKETAAYEAIW